MKYPFLIFTFFIGLITLFVLSCDTKNDPAVPNHNSSISTGNNNSFTVNLINYSQMFPTCGVVDTFSSKHFMMSAVDITSQFSGSVFFSDTATPSSSGQYSIINPVTFSGSFGQNQCLVFFKDPSNTSNPNWFIMTGSVNLDVSGAKPACSMSNVIAYSFSDTSKHETITGGINCH